MRRLIEGLGRFGRDTRGSVGPIAGICLVPVLGLAGAAVDYTRAADIRTDLARAVDAAALALTKQPVTATPAQLAAQGQAVFDSVYRRRGYATIDPVTVTRTGSTVGVKVAGTSSNAFMTLMGVRTTPVGAGATANAGTQRIELALVLDNTGSMRDNISGQRKIDALKSAAKDMLAKLRDRAAKPETVKVSLVPFDTEVRLPTAYRNAGWLRFASASDRTAWTGYVIDRYQPYDVDVAAPTGLASAYPGVRTSEYAWIGDLATLRPLTSLYAWNDYQGIVSTIEGMNPRGNTDLGIAFAWGMATLAPGTDLGSTSAPNDPDVKRFMVLLTDGDNTENHVNGVVNEDVDRINDRTRLACANVKGTGVEVFTIRLLMSNNPELLRQCASGVNGKDHYFDVQSSSELTGAFNMIIDAITGTRLTS